MILIQTKQVGAGKVFLMMPKSDIHAEKKAERSRERENHINKLRAMRG